MIHDLHHKITCTVGTCFLNTYKFSPRLRLKFFDVGEEGIFLWRGMTCCHIFASVDPLVENDTRTNSEKPQLFVNPINLSSAYNPLPYSLSLRSFAPLPQFLTGFPYDWLSCLGGGWCGCCHKGRQSRVPESADECVIAWVITLQLNEHSAQEWLLLPKFYIRFLKLRDSITECRCMRR
jgi:hypothetical protein